MDSLSLMVSVLFFIITMTILFLMRLGDRKDRSLQRVKKMQEQFRSEVARLSSQLKENCQQATNDIDARITAIYQLMKSLDDKIADVQGRGDDLTKLQAVLNNYRQVLGELERTTSQAEAGIREVRSRTAEIQDFRKTLDDFGLRMDGLKREEEEALGKSLASLGGAEEEAKGRLSDFASALEKRAAEIDGKIAASVESAEKAKDEALALLDRQSGMLRSLGQEMESFLKECEERCNRSQADVLNRVNGDLATFTEACSEKLEGLFKQTIEQIDASFLTMVRTSQAFINELDSHLASTREVTSALEEKSGRAAEEAAERLGEYSKQLSALRESTASLAEQKKRMEESVTAMGRETEALRGELETLKGEKASLIREMEERAAGMRESGSRESGETEEVPERDGEEPLPAQEAEEEVKKKVAYIPIGQEEEITLDDESE